MCVLCCYSAGLPSPEAAADEVLLRQRGVEVVDKGGRSLASVWPVFVHVPVHHGDRALDLLARGGEGRGLNRGECVLAATARVSNVYERSACLNHLLIKAHPASPNTHKPQKLATYPDVVVWRNKRQPVALVADEVGEDRLVLVGEQHVAALLLVEDVAGLARIAWLDEDVFVHFGDVVYGGRVAARGLHAPEGQEDPARDPGRLGVGHDDLQPGPT